MVASSDFPIKLCLLSKGQIYLKEENAEDQCRTAYWGWNDSQFGEKPLVWSATFSEADPWKHENGSKINTLRQDWRSIHRRHRKCPGPSKAALLIGSHSDSRNDCRVADGAMGRSGLEIVRAQRKIRIPVCLQWMLFRQDEESRFFSSMGSRSQRATTPELDGLCDKGYSWKRLVSRIKEGSFAPMEQGRYLVISGHRQGPQLSWSGIKSGLFQASSGGVQFRPIVTMMNIRKGPTLYRLASG